MQKIELSHDEIAIQTKDDELSYDDIIIKSLMSDESFYDDKTIEHELNL